MSRNLTLMLAILVPALVGLVPGRWLPAEGDVPAVASAPESTTVDVYVERPVLDLGRSPGGTVVEHTFVLRNRGAAPYRIIEVQSDCGCATTRAVKDAISPGEAVEVPVAYSTPTGVGPAPREINVILERDGKRYSLPLRIELEIVPKHSIVVYPTTLTLSGDGTDTAGQRLFLRGDPRVLEGIPDVLTVRQGTDHEVRIPHFAELLPFTNKMIQVAIDDDSTADVQESGSIRFVRTSDPKHVEATVQLRRR